MVLRSDGDQEMTKTTVTAAARDAAVLRIAKLRFEVETVESRNSDELDFHTAGIWAIRLALKEAFDAGIEAAEAAMKAQKNSRKPRPYHLLCSRTGEGQPFTVEFGAFDRDDVVGEKQSHRDSGIKAKDLRICTAVSSDKFHCDEAVARLNRLAHD